MLRIFKFSVVCLVIIFSNSFAQDIQKLQYYWIFDKSHSAEDLYFDQQGNLNAQHLGKSVYFNDAGTEYLELDGNSDALLLSEDINRINLPKREITVESVVRFREHADCLGIIGAFQDNGDFERGWVLGLDGQEFYFGLASASKKQITYISDPNESEKGKWYHLVGTYDGAEMKLFVNGRQVRVSNAQTGDILYPEKAWFMIGAYRDDDEFNRVVGSLREIKVYDSVLSEENIQANYKKVKYLTELLAQTEPPSDIIAGPYLQYATKNSIKILWETGKKSDSKVEFDSETPLMETKFDLEYKTLHEIELNNLNAQSVYFYRVISTSRDGKQSASKIYSFQTAVNEETAFAFGIVSDTQSNPDVWGRISTLIFNERPNFVVLAGDLVGSGRRKNDWLYEFFQPSHDLMSRVPIYTILGNHEGDLKYYYQYMANPEPEYFYTFSYGNVQFFMIDTDRKVNPGSEQYKWLEEELKKSKATWKFAVHHHPPYSSDENDYGDAYCGPSERGDRKLQPLVKLYEKYGLDICFYGHIHDYERTWPIKDNKVNQQEGVIYIQTGGGGGTLENYAPTRSWFTRKVHRDHNFLIANIHGNIFELQAIDHKGFQFDYFTFTK